MKLVDGTKNKEKSRRDAGATPELLVRDRGYLPHWEREKGTYFVTFRLADSLPKTALDGVRFEREKIVENAERQGRDLSTLEQARLKELFSTSLESFLDNGAGACFLARPEIASLVANALRQFDGDRYGLLAWCIMPNHIHVVLTASEGHALDTIIHSWKSYTAHRANKLLNRQGAFWEREYYDHLVRDEEELGIFISYVQQNPVNAHLSHWPWVWVRS